MKILGIDTSTADSSVAVMEDGIILGEFMVNQVRTHSETLVPIIKEVLDLLGMKVGDIDLFGVGIGPGSFTGIRIGMTVAKTLAQINEKPIVGVSSLEAVALSARAKYILPVINARGGRVYYSIFNEDMERLEEDKLIFAEDLRPIIDPYEEIMLIGDYNEEILADLAGDNIIVSKPIHNNLLARGVCQVAYNSHKKGQVDDYKTLRANYVRKSQAERDLK